MRTAPVKAIALPAVYRANLSFNSTSPFGHSRTRVMYAEGSALQCIHSEHYCVSSPLACTLCCAFRDLVKAYKHEKGTVFET